MPVRVERLAPSQLSDANSGGTTPPACTLLGVGQAFSGTQNVSSNQKDEAWRVNVRIQGCDLERGYLCGTMEALNVPMADTPAVLTGETKKIVLSVEGISYYFGAAAMNLFGPVFCLCMTVYQPTSIHDKTYCSICIFAFILLMTFVSLVLASWCRLRILLAICIRVIVRSDDNNLRKCLGCKTAILDLMQRIAEVVTFWEGEIVDTKNYNFFTGKWQATPEDDIKHWTKFPSFSHLLNQVEADGGKSLDLSNYPCIFMRWKEQYFVNVGTDCGLTIAGFYYVCFSCSDGSINGFYYDPNSSPFQKLKLKSTNEGRSGFSFSSYELR